MRAYKMKSSKMVPKSILILAVMMIWQSCKPSTTTVVKTVDEVANNVKKAGEIDHYRCFVSDEIKELKLSVSFDTYDNALEVKYIGQTQGIPLTYLDEVIITPSQPATKTIYKEIDMGEETGTYELTHSGNYDYIKYIRKKDGEVFNFTIDLELSVLDIGYRSTPCY